MLCQVQHTSADNDWWKVWENVPPPTANSNKIVIKLFETSNKTTFRVFQDSSSSP